MLDRKPMSLDQIERELKNTFRRNPNLIVLIRVDEVGLNKHTLGIIDRCQRNGITKFQVATAPPKTK